MQTNHSREQLKKFYKDDVKRVLKTLPGKVHVVFAARSALRVFPLFVLPTKTKKHLTKKQLIALCKAVLLPWAANIDVLIVSKIAEAAAEATESAEDIEAIESSSVTTYIVSSNDNNASYLAAVAASCAANAAEVYSSSASAIDEAVEAADTAVAAVLTAYTSRSESMQLVPHWIMHDVELSKNGIDLLTTHLFDRPLDEAYIAAWEQAYQVLSSTDASIPALIQSILNGNADIAGITKWLNQQANNISDVKIEGNNTASQLFDLNSSLTASALMNQHSTESVALVDALGREKVTQALASLLLSREDANPFAIGLFGHWGAGKSSQIEFLTKQLKKEELYKAELKQTAPNIKVATFNAWYNEKASNVGAMLAQTVVDALVEDVGFLGRFWLALRLAILKRSKLRRALVQDGQQGLQSIKLRYYEVSLWLRNWSLFLNYLLLLLVIGWVILNLKIPEWQVFSLQIPQWQFLDLKMPEFGISIQSKDITKGLLSISALIAAANHFVSKHLTDWFKKIDVDKAFSLFKLPDYSPHKGLSIEIHNTLRDICQLRLRSPNDPKQGDYLLLVVDDLDRCSVDTVKEVLDAVRLVAHIPRVVSLVAIDERMAFAAVEKHYQQFGHAGRTPALVARDYLAKVFQVSMTLPQCGTSELKSFIGKKMFGDVQNELASAEPVVDKGAIANPPERQDDLAPETVKNKSENKQSAGEGKPKQTGSTTSADKQVTPSLQAPVIPAQTALLEEKSLFEGLAEDFAFGNPRLLWRVYMAWKLLKSLYFSEVYTADQIDTPMRMLFWQEWLHTQEFKDKALFEAWMQNGKGQVKPAKMPEPVFDAVKLKLRKEWGELAQLRALVEIVLLPSSISLMSDSPKANQAKGETNTETK